MLNDQDLNKNIKYLILPIINEEKLFTKGNSKALDNKNIITVIIMIN